LEAQLAALPLNQAGGADGVRSKLPIGLLLAHI